MSTLDLFIGSRLLRALLLTGAVLCFVFFMAASYRLLTVERLSLAQVARAVPLVVPFLLPYLLPAAFVIALTLVYGRMVADGEVLAFASVGFSPRSLAWPAVLIGAALSLLSLVLTTTVVPACYRLRQAVYSDSYLQLVAAGEGEHVSLIYPQDGLAFYVRQQDHEGLHGVVIKYTDQGRVRQGGLRGSVVVAAEHGELVRQEAGRSLLRLHEVTLTYSGSLHRPKAWRVDDPVVDEPPPAPIRARMKAFDLRAGSLGGRRSVKISAYASTELRRQSQDALRTISAGGDPEAVERARQRVIEVRRELAERAAVAGAPLLLALLIVPLVFLLDARAPLIPFAVGLVASVLLFFLPHLLGVSLSERFGIPVFNGLGWLTCLAGALGFHLLGRRV